MRRLVLLAIVAAALAMTATTAVFAAAPADLLSLQTTAPTGRIVVKFTEASGVTVTRAGLAGPPETVARLEKLFETLVPGTRLERHFRRPAAAIAADRVRAEAKSGRRLPDLNAYGHLDAGGATAGRAELLNIVKALLADPTVATAFLEPRAVPAALGFDALAGTAGAVPPAATAVLDTVTPDYSGLQGYLGAPPAGVNALAVDTLAGGRGQGIRVVDIEGAWLWEHEDLPAAFWSTGGQIDDLGWRNHGTAVMGEIRGDDNGFGVRGIAPDCQVGASGIAQQWVADAIDQAAAATEPGDVILIELHAPGPLSDGNGQYGYLPMEYWQDNFDAIRVATALGRIVCEAAGNGQQDLDDPVYHGLFDPAVRFSGAIMCGAATSAGQPEWFTNHGQRVDLHGWGDGVTTTGYGNLQGGETIPEYQWYTDTFSGTSSASPIVVGSVVLLQGLARAHGLLLDAALAREILVATGTPQADDPRHIGPLPDVLAAWQQLQSGFGTLRGTVTDATTGLPLAGVTVALAGGDRERLTGADGAFAFTVAAGTAELALSHYFHQDAAATVTVAAGETTTVAVAMTPLPTVTVAGRVLDTAAAPVAGVRVTPLDAPFAPAATGNGGDYQVPGVPVGRTLRLLFDGVPGLAPDVLDVTAQEVPGGIYPAHQELAPVWDDLADAGGFSDTTGVWQWGTPTTGPGAAFSPPACWGVGLDANYPDDTDAVLVSPVYSFPDAQSLRLGFHYWADLESGFDGVHLRVRQDTTWVVVTPLSGYDLSVLHDLDDAPGWSGSSDGWRGAVFDLSDLVPGDVQFSLRFASDGGVNGAGFFLDDIAFDTGNAVVDAGDLAPLPAAPRLRAWPNPFNPRVTVAWSLPRPGPLSVRVYDLRGRLVRLLHEGPVTATAGVLTWQGRDDAGRAAAAGVYLVRLRGPDGRTAVRRVTLVR